MRNSLRALLAATLMVAMASVSAFAQGGSGLTTITGTVVDASGAVIPGATAVAKNAATGEELTGTSNEQGQFTIPAVQPGTYTVTVTLMSFKTAVLTGVRVNAGTPASVKVTLEVGGLNETVTVSGGSEIMQTQSASVTTTIDTNQILKLPTGSRSALEFVTTMAGVNTPGGSRESTINGLPQSAINITIDGISANDNHLKTGDGFFARVSPRLDAMEEVTVSSAAQDAANTGQGAVQIRFVTRSGSNSYTGSSYYYLQHYKLNANSWFNNRNGVAKNEDILHQPGTRLGGPIVVPGVWNGRNKGFFFVNYEQSRAPGQNTENRTLLHPRSQQGIFRYLDSGGTVREINVLQFAANAGLVSTVDPTIAKLLSDIRAAVGGAEVDLPDPMLQEFRYQYDTKNVTKYPTGRLDFNLTDKHRLSGSLNWTDLLSTPDTTNDREPRFPGFPGFGSQPSQRYTAQTNLRSTLTQNLVNELKVGGSGGATKFSPEISRDQYGGTSVANQDFFSLDLSANLGITNVHTGPTYSAREATTRILEDTLSYLKGSHNIQAGFQFTRGQVWLQNQQFVPTISFGLDANDPAQAIFSQTALAAAGGASLTTAQLTDARDLFAVLTGRITSIGGELRLNEKTDQYEYLGLGMQRARLDDYGFFLADTWRWKPNFTWNLGLRYELQRPFFPLNNSYSKTTIEDVCGKSGAATTGSCNVWKNGVMPGKTPTQYYQYNKGEAAYNTDWNNFAPNAGFAWTLGGSKSFLGSILGRAEGDSVIRAGYTLGYNRPGMSDFTGTIDDNPGISQSANRNHSLGNLGTPGSILFRNRSDLGPPAGMPTTRIYPMSDVVTGDIMMFEPNIQVPYSQTWTAGWQRKLTSDLAVEARYVGTRSDQPWVEYEYNENNLIENGIMNEFKLAQANLQSHIAAGCGTTGQPACSFAYRGAGTNPLPIALAYLNGRADTTNTAAYSGTNWTSTTFVNPLARLNPALGTWANNLASDAGRRANALTAGLPANFMVANPENLGGAEVMGNGGGTRYHSAQFELRKRLSHGFQFNANYVFGRAIILQSGGLRDTWHKVLDGGTEGGVTHAFKANWTLELPFGQGRKWGSSAGPILDRVIGGWSFDGVARIQSGRLVTLQGVKLVGMSVADLQKAFKMRFDDDAKLAWGLPQDIIDNTIRAFSISATTASGYTGAAPEGRYIAPGNCITALGSLNECTPEQITLHGPTLSRFDLSAVKRVTLKGRVNAEFRAEFLNAFNHPYFLPVISTSTNINNYRVTSASGSRTMQLVWRLNY